MTIATARPSDPYRGASDGRLERVSTRLIRGSGGGRDCEYPALDERYMILRTAHYEDSLDSILAISHITVELPDYRFVRIEEIINRYHLPELRGRVLMMRAEGQTLHAVGSALGYSHTWVREQQHLAVQFLRKRVPASSWWLIRQVLIETFGAKAVRRALE